MITTKTKWFSMDDWDPLVHLIQFLTLWHRLSSFLSLDGATLYYTFDQKKLNSNGLAKRQLNCDKFHNVKNRTLVHISPRLQAQGQKPLFGLSLQTVSLVQGIVGKQHERQVDYKWQKRSAGTQGELTSGGSRTGRSDVNVNTEVLDSQHCLTTAMLII